MQKRTSQKTRASKPSFFYTVLPQSRAGKSVLVSSILTQAYLQEIETSAVCGYPEQDAASTFSDYAEFIAKQEAYFDITKQQHNLLELPDLRAIPKEN